MFNKSYRYAIHVRHIHLVIIFVALFFLSACAESGGDIEADNVDLTHRVNDAGIKKQPQSHRSADTFYFGFDRRGSIQEDAKQYLPFLDYLSTATGLTFKLHFTPEDTQLVDELGHDVVQFAATGALGFIEAKSLFNAIPLVRGLNEQDKAAYRSFFVVRADSHMSTMADIKGQRLAFGSKSSTQGHLVPRIILKEEGLTLSDFKRASYTGSHINCAETVITDGADICGMQDTLATAYEKKGQIKVIHKSEFYPSSGIVANKQVADDVIQKVTAALLDFKPLGQHAAGLYHWEKTEMPHGFVLAEEKDYVELAKWADFFGFIDLERY